MAALGYFHRIFGVLDEFIPPFFFSCGHIGRKRPVVEYIYKNAHTHPQFFKGISNLFLHFRGPLHHTIVLNGTKPYTMREFYLVNKIGTTKIFKHTIVKTILFDGQVAGNIVSWDQSGEREIGYWIGKEYWGKGIGTKALAEFLGYVKTRPLWAHVAKHNAASQRVLQKCGFVILSENKFSDERVGEIEELLLKLK